MHLIQYISVLVGIIYMLCGIYVFQHNFRSITNILFAVICLIFMIWAFAFGSLIMAPSKEIVWIWHRLGGVGWTLSPPVIFHFILHLTRKKTLLANSWFLTAIYLGGLILYTRVLHDGLTTQDFILTQYGWDQILRVDSLWLYTYIVYYGLLTCVSFTMIFQWSRNVTSQRERKQAKMIAWTGITSLLLATFSNIVVRLFNIHVIPGLAPLFISIWIVGISFAVVRYKLMTLSPLDAAPEIINTMTDAMLLLDKDSTVIALNPAAQQFLSIPQSAAIGKPIHEYFPFDLRLYPKELQELLGHGPIEQMEIYINRPDWIAPKWISFSATNIKDQFGDWIGTVLLLHDITSHKMVAEAHKKAEEYFRSLVEKAVDVVIVWDPAGKILYCSPSIKDLIGMPVEQLIENADLDWVHPDDRAELTQKIKQVILFPGEIAIIESRVRHLSASWHSLEAVVRRVQDAHGDRIIVNARDVTQRKEMEAELARIERERIDAHLARTSRLASVGMLAAGVAHEINNPLTYVINNIEYAELQWKLHSEKIKQVFCRAQQLDLPQATQLQQVSRFFDELSECLRDALQGGHRIRQIVRDLKGFSRQEDEERSLVQLNDTINSALNLANNQIKYRAKIEKNFGELPPVPGNEGRLCQVFINLLVNAAQAIPEGALEKNTIFVSTRVDEDEVCVEIRDTGQGISPEHLERIFDPFFTTKPVGVGTGLGLSISHSIINAHHGRMSLHSQVGEGTTVTIYLPLGGDLQLKKAAEYSANPSLAEKKQKNGRVLIIDDDWQVANALNRWLAVEHQVTMLYSVKAAQELISQDMDFDVILCDIIMPEMTGIDFYQWMEKHRPNLVPHIIFMTGGTLSLESKAFLESIANPFFSKPIDSQELRNFVRERVKFRIQSREAACSEVEKSNHESNTAS